MTRRIGDEWRIEIITGPERRRRWSRRGEAAARLGSMSAWPFGVARLLASAAQPRASCSGGVASAWQKGLITDNRSARRWRSLPSRSRRNRRLRIPERKVRPTRGRKATRHLGHNRDRPQECDRVRVEGCTDAGLVARIISVLRRHDCVPTGVRVWLGNRPHRHEEGIFRLWRCSCRRGSKTDPHGGHLFVFRGRRGDLIKVILARRPRAPACSQSGLERGASYGRRRQKGAVTISPAQLGYCSRGSTGGRHNTHGVRARS